MPLQLEQTYSMSWHWSTQKGTQQRGQKRRKSTKHQTNWVVEVLRTAITPAGRRQMGHIGLLFWWKWYTTGPGCMKTCCWLGGGGGT
jgi:hypothetical protein